MAHDLVVLFEHPEWQKPLWAALERRGVRYAALDLKRAAFDPDAVPEATLYFNQASPSAYVRGNTRAVPLALSLMRSLELGGARVLNGSRAFLLELSKSAQAALCCGGWRFRIRARWPLMTPRRHWRNGPAAGRPCSNRNRAAAGRGCFCCIHADELRKLLRDQPSLWLPDNLLLLQEYFPVDAAQGIIRMEFLGGKLLYAMRVVSNGAFNLCPSEACNPEGGGESHCVIPVQAAAKPVEFYPYQGVPAAAVQMGERIMASGGLDVGGIEYLEAADGRRIFYDVNANSNLRAPIGQAFGFDPFERVVDYLTRQMERAVISGS